MALLSAADQQALRDAFAAMTRPVTILFFTQAIGCETCDETKQILREITEVTAQVTVEEVNLVLEGERAASYGIDRAPGLVLLAGDEKADTRIRMLGAPAGYDFMSLVDAILLVSGGEPAAPLGRNRGATGWRDRADHRPGVRHADLTALSAGRGPRKPDGVRQRADHVGHRAGSEFYDLARKYRVSGVPKTVGSNGAEILGALPEAQFVEELLGSDARRGDDRR